MNNASGSFKLQPMKQVPEWNPWALRQSPLFDPLHPVLERLGDGAFPGLCDYNALLDACKPPITVQSGKPLRFVAQQRGKLPFEAQYEPRCYLAGEVQTRERNWHDLFNALVWLTFPKAKAAINARHYRALMAAPEDGGRRVRERDMLTLLDESGVVVACADEELARLLRDFRWKDLFWRRRERLFEAMGLYLFGHGLYDKARQPYIGMTGQGLLLAVEREFFAWPLLRRIEHLDGLLAEYLAAPGHCRDTRELSPVPVLGMPGWSAGAQSEAFYDGTSYFRSGRLSSAGNRE